MKILITGFKPFNKETVNPTEIIINMLKEKDSSINTLLLNVEYNSDANMLIKEIDKLKIDVLICLGQAGGRSKVTIENFALNMQSAQIPDNANISLKHHPINESGTLCYQTNVDLEKLINNINDENLSISYHAGTFICNEIYYRALEYINHNKLNIKCIFVHIPYIKEQVENKPNMPYLDIEKSLDIISKIKEELLHV